jgi:excinuclease ABC subunit C
MVVKRSAPSFAGFGPCCFVRRERPVQSLQVGAAARTTRLRIRRECPRAPGVYGMIDVAGELVYVGQSKRLRDRLLSYFGASADSRARRIAGQAAALVWETTGHELTAQLRELMLIRRWQPRFNRRGLPGRRGLVYMCLGRRPAAYVYLVSKPAKTADVVFGPVAGFRRSQRAVACINDLLRLRDCPESVTMAFAEQAKLFDTSQVAGCLRYELERCSGPCIAACTGAQYADQVRQAKGLLSGADRSAVDQMASAMLAAARNQSYELAATMRDKLADVEWLLSQLDRLRQARADYSFVYPLSKRSGGTTWYFIRGSDVRHVVSMPRQPGAARRCLEALSQTYSRQPAVGDDPEDLEVVRLVAGWFRKRPDELQRAMSPAEAAVRCERVIQEKEGAIKSCCQGA